MVALWLWNRILNHGDMIYSVLIKLVKGLSCYHSSYKLYSNLESSCASDDLPTIMPPELLLTIRDLTWFRCAWMVQVSQVSLNGSGVLLLELALPDNSKYSIFEDHKWKVGKTNYAIVCWETWRTLELLGLSRPKKEPAWV